MGAGLIAQRLVPGLTTAPRSFRRARAELTSHVWVSLARGAPMRRSSRAICRAPGQPQVRWEQSAWRPDAVFLRPAPHVPPLDPRGEGSPAGAVGAVRSRVGWLSRRIRLYRRLSRRGFDARSGVGYAVRPSATTGRSWQALEQRPGGRDFVGLAVHRFDAQHALVGWRPRWTSISWAPQTSLPVDDHGVGGRHRPEPLSCHARTRASTCARARRATRAGTGFAGHGQLSPVSGCTQQRAPGAAMGYKRPRKSAPRPIALGPHARQNTARATIVNTVGSLCACRGVDAIRALREAFPQAAHRFGASGQGGGSPPSRSGPARPAVVWPRQPSPRRGTAA